MESSDPQKGRDGSQKRSPLDLIMNQIRRKRSFTERKQKPSVGRLFRPSESSDRKNAGIPEMKESEGLEGKENTGPGKESSDPIDSEICSVVGWGRVQQFVQKLGKKPDSQSLSLSHCDLTATDVVELATMLPFLTLLEVMDLSWNDLVGGSLKALTFHLQHVGKLKALRLSGCRLTAQDLTALGEALDSVPLLEVLELSWNAGVGGGNLQCITDHLHSGCMLKELHLADCQLTGADAKALGETLRVLSSLEVLDLSCNRLLGFGELAPSLSATPGLKTLRLHMCGLQQDSLCILGEALKFLPGLHHLDLSCNKGASGGFSRLATHLAQLTHLRSLDLHLCCLTEEDVQALVQVVPSLCELTELDVSSNKKIGAMAQSLFPVLPLSKMKRLPLNNCSLSAESYQALASAVLSLSQLESLNVSWNKSAGGNLKLLLENLQSNCKLQELRLSSCDLATEDLLHLEAASKRGALSQLKQLDLSYNGGVGDGGWAGLFGEAGGLKGLEELDISLRPSAFSSHASPWLPALLDALPHLPSLSRLALQRWALGSGDRDKLENALSKRSVVLECDKRASPAPMVAGCRKTDL